MTANIRGAVAVAFVVAITGAYQVSIPDMYATHENRASCERVNVFGDCEQDPPSQQDGGDSCVLVNALGACESQQEVDDPPHTMDR
ncbi:hypothetical protein [Mycobacteroides sp. LB1]|uniref:hypothetical protein n=1 Tax=Mycobacteroides sp. LB1 TaxID=2750814 RepID=UPI0015DE714A|nr:hypothetical protein [Mycobacteroides sp. LB1]